VLRASHFLSLSSSSPIPHQHIMDTHPPPPGQSGSNTGRLAGATSNLDFVGTQQERRHMSVHRDAANAATKPMTQDALLITSAKKNSVRAERLRQSGRAPSEPSQTPRWQITLRPAAIRCISLHIALRSQFRRLFSLCGYPIVNEDCGVVANCVRLSYLSLLQSQDSLPHNMA